MSRKPKKPITPKEFKQKLKEMVDKEKAGDYNREVMHVLMDALAADLLDSLGYEEGSKIFREANKGFA